MGVTRRAPHLRLVAATAIAGVVALLGATAPGVGAEGSGGSDDVDMLTASRDEVRAELAALEARYDEQRAAVERAEAAQEAAAAEVERAEARVRRADEEVEAARRTVARYAVEAYIHPPAQDALRVLSITEADEASFAANVIQILTEERHRVVGVLVEKKAQADRERSAAREAAERAREAANEAQLRLVELDRMRSEQQALAAQLDDRLDHALAEAAMLAELDRRTAEELAAQELALRESGPPSPPEAVMAIHEERRPPAATPATQQPTTTRPRTPGPTTTRPPTTNPPPPAGTVTWNDVTRVGGIWVHTSIASNVRDLLNAATAAGFNLAGGGYRDPQGQIDTRRANCGTSYYDIYLKPASQCVPPTARPGTSMHERGLAIDFTSSGSLITSRSNPAFVWLQANAARYGLYNLPSEPWHWSTNGN